MTTQPECEPVAIIGMAGRFPGARDVHSLWANLCGGVESVVRYSEAQLKAAGASSQWLSNPGHVRAGALADGLDRFDAEFFGVTPRDAELMDPQLRLALETVWEALEDAGVDPTRDGDGVALMMGASLSSYLFHNLLANQSLLQRSGAERVLLCNDKDFYPTTISYRLNLRGPSIAVGTGCSSSLVAVHLAVRSLLAGECKLAVAGASSVHVPLGHGYLYVKDGIYSPDGHCRVFDAAAKGTVGADGAAFVVLKRYDDAIADRDRIYALLLGSAVNNDGAVKAGYTAPSPDGQAAVIREAMKRAGVRARDVRYVEAHGTGTILGDPIEVAALADAFRDDTRDVGRCAVGSLKANIGHLDTAAGVAGLIKATLAVRTGVIPPAVNFETPNPRLRLADSPFFVNTTLLRWPDDGSPRCAGVSAFGVGGTNVHVIVREAPPAPACSGERRPCMVPVSARSHRAFRRAADRLASAVAHDHALSDVEFTLARGRKQFAARRAFVASTREELLDQLDAAHVEPSMSTGRPKLLFFAPPRETAGRTMGRELFEREPRFRRAVLECLDLLPDGQTAEHVRRSFELDAGADVAAGSEEHAVRAFVLQYALGALLIEWGARPDVILGIDVGELVAAGLSGALHTSDAIALAVSLGGDDSTSRAMAIALSARSLASMLPNDVSIAAVCGPELSVVTGPIRTMEGLRSLFSRAGVACTWVRNLPNGIPSSLAASIRQTHAPVIPIISPDSGALLDASATAEPRAWHPWRDRKLRLDEALQTGVQEASLWIELGSGRTLSALVRRNGLTGIVRLAGFSARAHGSELRRALECLGWLWERGIDLDWPRFLEARDGRVCSLPTYPFESQRYWIEAPRTDDPSPRGRGSSDDVRIAPAANTTSLKVPPKRADLATWFYSPVWRSWPQPTRAGALSGQRWLLFSNGQPAAQPIEHALRREAHDVVLVRRHSAYVRLGSRDYRIRLDRADDYIACVESVLADGRIDGILHAWTLQRPVDIGLDRLDDAHAEGIHSLLFTMQALGRLNVTTPVRLAILTNNTQAVAGGDLLRPEQASLKAVAKIAPQEYPNVRSVHIDLDLRMVPDGATVERIIALLDSDADEPFVACRDAGLLKLAFEQATVAAPSPSTRLKERGVYLITGGLGGIALSLAEFLARETRARLVLVGRSGMPPRSEWERLLAGTEPVAEQIRRIQRIEALGADVKVHTADVCDYRGLEEIVRASEDVFGPIDGVIHAAGLADTAGVIQRRTRDATEQVMAAKVRGTLVLSSLFRDRHLDLFVLCSSLATAVYGLKFGEVGYVAANDFLNAYSHVLRSRGTGAVAIAWTDWQDVGMSAEAWKRVRSDRPELEDARQAPRALVAGMTTAEGVQAFRRAIAIDRPEVLISTQALDLMLEQQAIVLHGGREAFWTKPAASPDDAERHGEVEAGLRKIWRDLLGVADIQPDDDFFDLGGDSLVAVRMIAQVKEAFGVDQSLAVIFDAPTLRQFAGLIRSARTHLQPVD